MKVVYRGHEIEAKREKCLAGYRLLYFSVFRQSDGYECVSSFTTGSDTASDMIGYLKERIDAEVASADPWGEAANQNRAVAV